MNRHKKKAIAREAYQKKTAIKGHKSMRGQPENPYGELKKNATHSLTPTAIDRLKSLGKATGLSASETLEHILRLQSLPQILLTALEEDPESDTD